MILKNNKDEICDNINKCIKAKKRLCGTNSLMCAVERDEKGNTIRELIINFEKKEYNDIVTGEKYS